MQIREHFFLVIAATDHCVSMSFSDYCSFPADPYERVNLASRQPKVVAQLMNRLAAYEATMIPPGKIYFFANFTLIVLYLTLFEVIILLFLPWG